MVEQEARLEDAMSDISDRNFWPKEWPEWPRDRKAQRAATRQFVLGLRFLNDPLSNRKSRLAQADERSQYFWSQMTGEEQKRAMDLVALWEQNATIMQSIRYEETKKGIGEVDHLLSRWGSAEIKTQEAEEEASQLGLAVYEYFKTRVERFCILQEEKDESGQYKNYPDYSEVREQWYSRKPITGPLPWPWDYMLMICKLAEVREQNIKKWSVGRKLAIAGVLLTIAGIVVTVIMDIF